MSRTAAATVQNKFIKGLITEVEGLGFPEDAVTETSNCVFNEKSLVTRRLGIDFEEGFDTQTADRTSLAVANYYWRAAAGNGDNALAVLQVGETLYFYLQDTGALSDDMIDTIDLTDFSPSGAPSPGTTECDFASGNGLLFVSHPNLEPFFVEFDSSGPSVTGTQIDIEIRDFEGLDDGFEIDERPAVNTDAHKYNLYNQGWFVDDMLTNGGSTANVLTTWEADRSDSPANTDIWYTHLRAGGAGVPEVFDPADVGHEKGNSPAPKGHFVLNAFEQDRSDVSGIGTFTVISSDDFRPSTITFFAGRVWYSGVTGQAFSNKVYFSQIVERNDQLGACYQINDPTDRNNFDILPSDGGVFTIQEAGTIIKLFALQSSILVFATNGVWSITGSEGIGFKATDFSISKISGVGALSISSFVDINGVPSFWNEDGIFIASDNNGAATINSLTDQTIKSFVDDIPDANKAYVRGYFNGRERVVQWVYRSSSFANLTEAYTFDSVLCYNVITNAFYPWTVDSSPVSINGIICIKNPGSVTKYVCSYADAGSYEFTFAEERDTDYLDWFSKDSIGVDYSSYFVSGYALHGDAQRKFQPTYVYLFNKSNGVTNSFDFKSQWNFANSGDTGRWSSTQRLTFTDDDYDYQFRRVKTRGHGIALQFRISSVTGTPFGLIGWSTFETQNSNV